MFMGHYATALVAYEKVDQRGDMKAPFWLFLVAAQFLDFIMVLLVALGVESFLPENLLHLSFAEMQTDMFVTHDVLPVLGWAGLFGGIVYLLTKEKIIALWCMGLVLMHEVFDLLVGFKHNIMGKDSMALGTNLYTEAPLIGLIIEAVICFGLVWWFVRHREKRGLEVSKKLKWGLYLILVGGTVSTLPMANHTIGSLLGF